jgi:hypothetical protein
LARFSEAGGDDELYEEEFVLPSISKTTNASKGKKPGQTKKGLTKFVSMLFLFLLYLNPFCQPHHRQNNSNSNSNNNNNKTISMKMTMMYPKSTHAFAPLWPSKNIGARWRKNENATKRYENES